MADANPDFSNLKALFINTTLTRSPGVSHTQLTNRRERNHHGQTGSRGRSIPLRGPSDRNRGVSGHARTRMGRGCMAQSVRRVQTADILVIAGPIWLGDNSSETKKSHRAAVRLFRRVERQGPVAVLRQGRGLSDHGKRGRHQALCIQCALQPSAHRLLRSRRSRTPGGSEKQGPGRATATFSEDGTRLGVDNEFTNRNTTFMTWNMLHMARMLKSAGGFPAQGNQRSEWDAGARFDFQNPEYRS